MFKSIRVRFIAIYFTLVLVAMMIVGLFIVKRLENTQLLTMEKDMLTTASTMVSSSEKFSSLDWINKQKQIQTLLEDWKINSNYQLYAIYDPDQPKIIAAANVNTKVSDQASALAYKGLDPDLIFTAFSGQTEKRTRSSQDKSLSELHLTYPIYNYEGQVNGIFYMIGNLEAINNLLLDSKKIIISAGLVALLASIILGLILSSTITNPIRDLTKKVAVVAKGDYSQKVQVKSDDEIGKLAQIFNFFTDQLQDTISDMELERAKLNTIFQYMAEGVLALDTNNNLIHINQVAKEILKLEDLDIKYHRINLQKLNIYGIDYSRRTSLEGVVAATIDNRHYNLIYGPYLDDLGLVSGIIIVFQDVSKEHRLDQMRKDFVANVSHELKTPLTTIKTYTETLMDNDMDQEVEKNFLSIIDKETDRMARLVQDLLELSNIDSDAWTIDLESLNLNKLIDNCIGALETLRAEKSIVLEKKIYTQDLEILNHRDSLEKIIMNILSNAYKYTEEKGTVSLELMDYKDSFRLTVKDNGIGIPYADQKHIFERFYRVEKARSRKAGGTGLGLSIAKELVEKLGGTILLKSKPNIGTEISLIFKKNLEVDNER
ncbi:MAG: ATP-binding protein [Bacillota bacterium]|nr:ATP-binding protein [Bacillota bacterium]